MAAKLNLFRIGIFSALFLIAQLGVLQHASSHFHHSHNTSCASFLSAENNTPHCANTLELTAEKPVITWLSISLYNFHNQLQPHFHSRAPPHLTLS